MPTHSRCHAHPAFSLIWRFTHTPAHSEPGQCLPPAQPQLGRDVQTSPHFSRVGPDDGDRRPVVSSDGPWLVVAVSGLWVGAPSVLRVGAPSVFGSRSLVLFLGFVPLLCSWVSFPRFAVGFRSLALLGCVPFLCWVAFPSFVGLRSLAHRPRSVARPRRRTPDDSASLSSVAHISMFPVSFRLGLAPRALRLLLLVGHRFVRAPTVQFVTQGVGQDVRGP